MFLKLSYLLFIKPVLQTLVALLKKRIQYYTQIILINKTINLNPNKSALDNKAFNK